LKAPLLKKSFILFHSLFLNSPIEAIIENSMTPISIESVPCPLPSVRIVIPEASVSMPATVTPPTSSSSDASPAPPQALPVEPLISRSDSEEEEDEEIEAPAVSPRQADKEKIGRWSEYEHLVFLDGLRLYGKQWKTIAGMIGTRTVVQVRTHAQKYFQKVDRSGSLNDAASIARPVKRKSLTLAPPSRKARKMAPRRSMPTIPTMTTTELAL
jgi:SHAQKYF class myb-like DNA-binding protein